MGTVIEPVPVTGLAANFSPIPRMAPPPLGSEMEGAFEASLSSVTSLVTGSLVGFICINSHQIGLDQVGRMPSLNRPSVYAKCPRSREEKRPPIAARLDKIDSEFA
jgi:hypothetical protein